MTETKDLGVTATAHGASPALRAQEEARRDLAICEALDSIREILFELHCDGRAFDQSFSVLDDWIDKTRQAVVNLNQPRVSLSSETPNSVDGVREE